MSLCAHASLVLVQDRRGHQIPRSGMTDRCGPRYECWEPNLDHPQEQGLLVAEPSLQPLKYLSLNSLLVLFWGQSLIVCHSNLKLLFALSAFAGSWVHT